jgi:HlyD family secretion protein
MAEVKTFRMKKIIIAAIIVAAVVFAVWFIYRETGNGDSRVKASGMVEVTEVQLAPLVGGRIIELAVKESDEVNSGDLVARLSLDGADRELEMAEAAVMAAKQRALDLKSGFRKEDIAKARAEVSMREAQYRQAVRDRDRFANLEAEGVVSKREAELQRVNADSARSALNVARENLNLLKTGMKPEQIAMAEADVKRAEAAYERAKVQIDYKTVYSPADGVILSKNFEVGDVVSPGSSIATLGKMDSCWVKLYIPSTQLGLVKIGQEAEVRVDSYPDRVFKAQVTEVNQKAEYNPRLSLTQKQRANMVFWIKISIDDDSGVMKPGMPVDVVLL